VMAFKPSTLEEALEYALHMESATDTQFKRLKSQSKFAPSSSFVPKNPERSNPLPSRAPITRSNQKNNLIDQRRVLGLCFKCGERYYPGHQCKVKLQLLLGQEDEGMGEVTSELPAEEPNYPPLKEAYVSIHATSNNIHTKTMRFKM
jgi:hypothetical protein